jgi:hypothetical protein
LQCVVLRADFLKGRARTLLARTLHGMSEPGIQQRRSPMLVTLVAVLCNSQLCLEKIVTTSDQSGITMSACAVNAQIGIADWLAKGPYREWRLQRYKCVLGKYVPKNEA